MNRFLKHFSCESIIKLFVHKEYYTRKNRDKKGSRGIIMDNFEKKKMQEDEDIIDVLQLGKELLLHWQIILAAALIGALATFAWTKLFVAPTYQSSFTAYVNNRAQASDSSGVSSSDISASRSLASTYAEIIVSPEVIEEAYDRSGIASAVSAVRNAVSVSSQNGTEIIKIKVTMEDPQEAYQFACALQDVTSESIAEIVEGSSVKIVAHAKVPTGRFAPNYGKMTAMGFLAGFLALAGFFTVLFFLDNRVKSPEEVAEKYEIVYLGTIHELSQNSGSGYGYYGQYGHNK